MNEWSNLYSEYFLKIRDDTVGQSLVKLNPYLNSRSKAEFMW